VSLLKLARFAVAVFLVAGVATATNFVTVYTSIAPDPFGSPATFDMYSLNCLTALENGLSSYGTPGTPEYYQQTGSFTPGQVIGTGFPSWDGQAPPPAGYSTQTGNMLMFGAVINGNGQDFNLTDVSFVDDFFGQVGPIRTLDSVGFGARLVGIGADGNCYGDLPGCLATGTSSTPLTEAFFSGFGDQFYIADQADLATGIAEIEAASQPNGTGTYTLTINGIPYSGSGEAGMIPEPATFAVGGIGLLLFLARKRAFSRSAR
jgi:hypothetical protein